MTNEQYNRIINRINQSIIDKIDKRQSSNKEILNILSNYIETHPDMRFGQLLTALHLTETTSYSKNFFNEESYDTLHNLKKISNNIKL